jgi:acetylserotonin N-methyltransferase
MKYELPAAQDREIWDIWLSMHNLPAMAVADELGIFQALAKAPATAAETSRHLGLNQRATGVLCSMLTALRLLVSRDGQLELSEVARTYLLPQSPYYWGPLLRVLGVVPPQRAALIRALRASEDGAAMASANLASPAWERGQMSREQAESVSRVMHCHSLPAAVVAARNSHFEEVSRLLDVGGGSGCFSIAIAQRLAAIRCSVMELPAVCEVARGYIEEGSVADRVDTVAVDMFREAWPRGYDGVLFSNVFHDWNAENNLILARRAHEILPSGGRVFVHEMLLAEDGSGPPTTASFSILMLFGTQGRQYSRSEVFRILAESGFVDLEVAEAHGYYSMISGRKP